MTDTLALLDTGPLVSFLASGLRHHAWAVAQWSDSGLRCSRANRFLTEAAFLLPRQGREADALFELLDRGVMRIGIQVQDEEADLRALMRRYRNRPMSLADACLVRLSEYIRGHASLLSILISEFTGATGTK